MSAPVRLLFVVGTRPEAIKLAPVVRGALAQADRFDARVVATGQHREMLHEMLREFAIPVHADLDLMQPDQQPADVAADAIRGLDAVIGREQPDWVLVQGDTTTSFAGALAAFYRRVRVAHVEAGLRTWNREQPFPEELHRRLTGQLAELHFAPTPGARDNLLREGIDPQAIRVTGNTAIDALFLTLEEAGSSGDPPVQAGPSGDADAPPRRTLLLTAHRRENHGAPLEHICAAVRRLVERFADLEVHYPVHPSPRVRRTVEGALGGLERVRLTEPLGYRAFVLAMQRAHLILTDSGGVQEEAPSLGRPVLVLRETTERPEGIEAGTARLVGTDPEKIVAEASRLLEDAAHYRSVAEVANPYGDGKASERILGALALE